jgi:predicted ATPase with chaperone activity
MNEGAYLLMMDRLNELKTKHAPTFNKIITNSSFWYHWLSLANRGAQFDLAWVKTLIKQSASFAHDAEIASTINTKEQRGYTLSKDIRRAFNAALLSMEKQNKDFIVPQSIKTKNGLLSKEEDLFLTEEMKHILQVLKEDRAMRASHSRALGATSRSLR